MVTASNSNAAQPRSGDGKYTFWQRGEDRGLNLDEGSATSGYLDDMLGDAARHDALLSGGYVEPRFFSAMTDPKNRAGIEAAWDQSFAAASHNPDDSGYPKMPDGYTPGGHSGRSLEGNRRTYRRAYEVDGWNIRMHGSATAAKRFSREVGRTFEMPVTTESPDGVKTTGWVLVTNGGPGNWQVTPPPGSGERGENIASAVQAVLEAKRPTMIPRHAGGITARARERAADKGVALNHSLRSRWMDSIGYDDDESMMVMRTSAGGVYGYSVPRETAAQVAYADSPGAVFNKIIKFKGHDTPVTQCEKCSRVHSVSRAHKCPVQRGAAPTEPQRTSAVTKIGSLSVAARSMTIRKRAADRLSSAGQAQIAERQAALSNPAGERITPASQRTA